MIKLPQFVQKVFLVLFLTLGGSVGLILVHVIALYLTGGVDLINEVWLEESKEYNWLVFVAVFLGGIPGAAIAAAYFVRLMSKNVNEETTKN